MHTPTLWVPHLVQLSCQMDWGAWADSQSHLCFGCLSVTLGGHVNAFFHPYIYLFIGTFLSGAGRLLLPPRGKFPVCPYKASLHRLLFFV